MHKVSNHTRSVPLIWALFVFFGCGDGLWGRFVFVSSFNRGLWAVYTINLGLEQSYSFCFLRSPNKQIARFFKRSLKCKMQELITFRSKSVVKRRTASLGQQCCKIIAARDRSICA